MYPELRKEQIARVVKTIAEFLKCGVLETANCLLPKSVAPAGKPKVHHEMHSRKRFPQPRERNASIVEFPDQK